MCVLLCVCFCPCVFVGVSLRVDVWGVHPPWFLPGEDALEVGGPLEGGGGDAGDAVAGQVEVLQGLRQVRRDVGQQVP